LLLMAASSPSNKVSKTPGSLKPGDAFGRYHLLELIGKGGMAEVFRAVAQGVQGFERVFVLKRIRPDRSDSPKMVHMFCEEARISALLHHPNIVQIYDFGQIDSAYFMVMEYLAGKDLSTVMRAVRGRRGAMPPSLAAFVAREIARALHHAHTLALPDGRPGGIVHRDVTPSNIMLLTAGGVKILDFGIAKAAALARRPDASGKPPRLAGKLAYLSPEQVRGTPIDHRSDIFSLGVVLWEMVAGERLFVGKDDAETLHNVLMLPIAEPSRRRDGIPAVLDAIVARALEREATARYETADEFANDLDRFLVEMPMADQAIPKLLEEIFSASPPPKPPDVSENASVTYTASGTAGEPGSTHGTGSRIDYRTIPPPRPPRIPMLTLIGIFAMVVAAVVIVGRIVLRH
jgi:eukaryotic-like serine/threonine-protein kinase